MHHYRNPWNLVPTNHLVRILWNDSHLENDRGAELPSRQFPVQTGIHGAGVDRQRPSTAALGDRHTLYQILKLGRARMLDRTG